MTRRRRLIHTVFLVLLPLIVAAFDFGVFTAALLVVAMLLWRWLIVLSGIVAPEKTPQLELEVTEVSHFSEKVRWCMDRLGLDYQETRAAGIVGLFFVGRTVPRLRVRTGLAETVIGNSPEILRYLWGTCAAPLGDKAAFLEPTAERLELEQRLDRYGRNLQVWVFNDALRDRDLALHVWGANSPHTPAWQRQALRATFPVLRALMKRSLRLSDNRTNKAAGHIEELLSDIDTRLADGRRSILGGDEINYTDIAFASLSAMWLRPEQFASGTSAAVLVSEEQAPARMREDVARWREDYPKAVEFVERLYAEER